MCHILLSGKHPVPPGVMYPAAAMMPQYPILVSSPDTPHYHITC